MFPHQSILELKSYEIKYKIKKTLVNDNHYHNINLNQIPFFIMIIVIKILIF